MSKLRGKPSSPLAPDPESVAAAVIPLASHLHRVGNGCVVERDPLLTSTHLASPDPSATCLNTLMI
jgi:hypothetical protein